MEAKITGDPQVAAAILIRYLQRGGSDVFGTTALDHATRDLAKIETQFAANIALPVEVEAAGAPEIDDENREDVQSVGLEGCEPDDAASVASLTSTVKHRQEPFDTYKERIMALALVTIWPGADSEQIEIERIRGGSYNRVIALTRHGAGSESDTDYIIRIPREQERQNILADAAVLLFVQRHTKIPVARIIHLDDGSDNMIDNSFMVQERLQGQPMHFNWRELNHQQKCNAARQIGFAYREMLSIRSTAAGALYLPENDPSLESQVLVLPLTGAQNNTFCKEAWPSLEAALPFSSHAATENTQAVLARMVEDLRDDEGEDGAFDAETYDRFDRMINELNEGGWLDNVDFCLAHLDLFPRNVMINPEADEQSSVVTGILDWDSALLAPAFVACQPPQWIWDIWDSNYTDSDSEDDHDETTANDEPQSPEGRQLKALFEEAAGEIYLRLAYKPAYRLARRLFRLLLTGVDDQQEADVMMTVLREWKKFYGGYPEEDWFLD